MADDLHGKAAKGDQTPELYDEETGQYLGLATPQQCDVAARFKRRVAWIDAEGRAYARAADDLRLVRIRHHPVPMSPDVKDDPRWDTEPSLAPGEHVRRLLRDAKDFVLGLAILLIIVVGGVFVMWLFGEGVYHCTPEGACR